MYDMVIIGGGIIGLSTAMHLAEMKPGARIAVLEKESELGMHQTGHNSGVIHSGIYYKPGSLKAKFARTGNQALVDFCDKYEIAYERCGKVIVATEDDELPLLNNLYERGLANQLAIAKLTPEALHEIEPHVQGKAAIHVPSTGIVDYQAVLAVYAEQFQATGGIIQLSTEVKAIREHSDRIEVVTDGDTVEARFLVNCAGLFSDRVAKMAGVPLDMRIVPFRGEYYELKPTKHHLVNHLIYPVPNPDFPFLGVHFTRMMDGNVHLGPNAVLGLKREGYRKRDVSLQDSLETLTYTALWKIASQYAKVGLGEIIRSFSKKAFVRNLQRFIPEIKVDDLVPSEAGVRAQALGKDGKLLDDFVIVTQARSIHVCNAPSPAATASLMIGRYVAQRIQEQGVS